MGCCLTLCEQYMYFSLMCCCLTLSELNMYLIHLALNNNNPLIKKIHVQLT
jgi:hypothetical protein